jgi:hypothetical protein
MSSGMFLVARSDALAPAKREFMSHAVLRKLRAFVLGSPVVECELCAGDVTAEHEHLLEPDARRVYCACEACARAANAPATGARYLRVERRAVRLGDIDIDDVAWSSLGVASELAFFTTSSRTREVVATSPGRAGLVESLVPLRAWARLEARFPALVKITPDVEALLVRRTSRHRDYFHVSIDRCYELTELVRAFPSSSAWGELSAVQNLFESFERLTNPRRHSRRPGS